MYLKQEYDQMARNLLDLMKYHFQENLQLRYFHGSQAEDNTYWCWQANWTMVAL